METDPTRMCELLVGLPDVNVLGVDDSDVHVVVSIETRGPRPACLGCGQRPRVKDRDEVLLVDLPVYGRPSVAAVVAQASMGMQNVVVSGEHVDVERTSNRSVASRTD